MNLRAPSAGCYFSEGNKINGLAHVVEEVIETVQRDFGIDCNINAKEREPHL
jgi:hypothetical protein